MTHEAYNPDEQKSTRTIKSKGDKAKKTPSLFFDKLTFVICVVVLLGSAAYGARIALETVVGGIGAWIATVIALYITLYTLYKLRTLL